MTRYYHNSNFLFRFFSGPSPVVNIIQLTFFALTIFIVSSCEEVPTKIGNGLLPGSDFVSIESTDTMSVWSYTMYDNSFRTDNPTLSYMGQIYDPYFGTTNSGFVSQIRMGARWDPQSFTVDSMKMILHLSGVRGAAGVEHTIRISEISNQIYTDSAYYSDRKVDTTGFGVSLKLPVLRTDTLVNTVIINVPKAFGEYLTRDTTKMFYNNNKSDFRAFFKGIYVRILPSADPLIATLSLVATSSTTNYQNYFILFLHNDANTYGEFYFVLDAVNKNAAFNVFSHDFTTATLGNKMVHRNDTSFSSRDTVSYQQSLDGVYTKIKMPGLEKIKKDPSLKNIAVNKARITVPFYTDGSLYKASTIPSTLFLRYTTTDGYKYVVPDYNVDTYHAFFSGAIDSTANVYSFNIPSFVQGYLRDATGKIKPELEFFLGDGTRNVILKTSKNKTPVKFELTYTKF